MKPWTLLLVIFAIVAILHLQHSHEKQRSHLKANTRVTDVSATPAPSICIAYPHALVQCGIHSTEEFEAHRNDRDLREHYSEVGLVHPAVLKADEWDFASFRWQGGIVWTPKRILIRAGEQVFRDQYGNTIRARCGNRLSAQPQAPVAAIMPPEMEKETPVVEFVEPPPSILTVERPSDLLVPPLPTMPPQLTPPVTLPVTSAVPPAQPVVPELWHPGIWPPAPGPGQIHVGEAPEPGTFLLLLGPIALFLLWRRV